ncbi:dihydrolipoamide acetyltransferase family protein [Streptomyces sp. 11x1]|uniref:dihydrolipoamide acetyltransferase family protein n=1 Tax=Streptomyces sp. 11x1 TaxID=3038642 RepID=UPI00292D9574|nr:dihydrolipoamide acetyltransferase family protein [Streptomyces sp. 11x1]WNZ13590.1 dihydrolipoamide acetyltransferase family protein [Streptomyces sp. 11x1]
MTTATRPEQLFRLPDLGEGLTEAEIVEWKVAVGDTVTVDQVVVEVETAKAAVEVPVPYAGTVLRLHAEAGTALPVGEPLITVGEGVPAVADGSAGGPRPEEAGGAPEPLRAADAAAERYREEEQAGSGNVLIGYGTGHGPTTSRRRRRAAAAAGPSVGAAPAGAAGSAAGAAQRSGAVDSVAPDTSATATATATPTAAPAHAPRVISPLVRRMARDHGVDLGGLSPSGPAGVVLRRDVEQAVARAAGQATSPSPAHEAAAPVPAPQEPTTAAGPERIPLRGVRRAVADKLSRSRTEIPDATTWVDVDATGLLEAKKALESAGSGTRIGLLALFARICVAGLRRFPELNSTVDTERREILRHDQVHLGFAAQTERGLVVPVVRDAHLMTTVQLAAELARLTELARGGNLPPYALTGGTFTLNNYGVFGVDGSTPIINHPEAALLGVGRLVDKPWVVDGRLTVRRVTQLSFSFDHRVCDGGVAGGFLRFVADCVERPAILLADV